MKQLKLALMGFGNVGQAFAEMLLDKHDEIAEKYNRDVIVTVITTATKGNLYCPEGIDLVKALDDVKSTGRFDESRVIDNGDGLLLHEGDYDCLVELTPLDIFTGKPATDHLKCGGNCKA